MISGRRRASGLFSKTFPCIGICFLVVFLMLIASNGICIAELLKPGFGKPLDSVSISDPERNEKNADGFPYFESMLHDVNNLGMQVSNSGRYTTAEFPRNSEFQYLSGCQLWIGGIRGRDTLVSARGFASVLEFSPDQGESGAIIRRSLLRHSDDYHKDAISEQDFICTFTDTLTDAAIIHENQFENRPHIPLHLSVHQNSYAWGIPYAEDFIIVDCQISNIGSMPIKDMYIALWVGGLPRHTSVSVPTGLINTGFLSTLESPPGSCQPVDSVIMAWFADNDGKSNIYQEWEYTSPRSVIAVQILSPLGRGKRCNFNWFSGQIDPKYNWGPRRAPTDDDPFREFAYHYMGTPLTDKDMYYMMSHPEVDYDQMFTAIGHTDEGFLPPPEPRFAAELAGGFNTTYLLSIGPYSLDPGDSIPFTFAFIAGENFHVNPWDYRNYFDPYHPQLYYDKLDFSDLARNSQWARAVYDNPGIDTDDDGYSGEFCWIYTWRDTTDYDPSDSFVVDSIRQYYTGDSIPDFKAMMPPPPPEVRVYPDYGKITLRWNGQESETTPDFFSGVVDFEGYRVYYGQGDRLSDFVLLASYDIDDYIVYHFDTDLRLWRKISNSARHDSLKQVHGNDFDADEYYDQFHYFHDYKTGEIYYFTRQDWNQSDLSNQLGIHKVYPNASPDDLTDITEEGWRRCYEYEYIIDNLEPSIPYWFAVTAFDYGSFQYGIGQLETSPLTNMVKAYALPAVDTVEHRGLEVTVYPNPYRITDRYARAGYENRDRTKAAAWSRRIHFANLPKICTIRIYTVAGDLVREIKHYCPEGDPDAQHEEWNMVSRNTQAIVTGIYIWHVRSEMGDQIGKLVIIK